MNQMMMRYMPYTHKTCLCASGAIQMTRGTYVKGDQTMSESDTMSDILKDIADVFIAVTDALKLLDARVSVLENE